MEAALLCLHTPFFSILISLIFLLALKSLTSDLEQLSDKHESIFSGSCSDVIEKDVRAAQPLSDSILLTLPVWERWKGKLLLWNTSFGVPKIQKHSSCHCLILPSPKESVLFLAVKVSMTLVLNLNQFTDIGVRIECTVLRSQYWLSEQPKLLLFPDLFSPSPLQISGNLSVPWITGCSRKRAVSTFPLKYLMHQVKQWKVDENTFLKMSLFTLGGFFPVFLWYKHYLQVQCFSWGEDDDYL